jgi:plastocyanin
MKTLLVLVIVATIVFALGFFLLSPSQQHTAPTITSSQPKNSHADPSMDNDEGQQPDKVKAEIKIVNGSFTPKTVTVSVGTNVFFENKDTTLHKVKGDNTEFYSDDLKQNQAQSVFTASKAGTFTFSLVDNPNEKGSIVVTQ